MSSRRSQESVQESDTAFEYDPEAAKTGESDVQTRDGLLLDRNSTQDPTLSVVMPTLNEEEGVAECIERAKTAISELGVPAEIILSDSSTDRTPEIGREMGAIIVTPDEPGYGYAYRYAFERARGEYIVIGDADTTYDFERIPELLDRLEETGADMVMGSRLEGEIKSGAMPPLHQYIGNPLLTKFLNAFYGAGVSDAHSGFRIIRQSSLDALDLKSDGMEFASEMIMEAGAKDMVIKEVPITYHEREGEATLESFKDGWRHVRFMLVNAPGYLFSAPGAVLSGIGLLVMALVSIGESISGITPGVHSMIAGSLLTIVGYQIGTLGVFAAITSDPIQKPEDPITERVIGSLSLEHGATTGLAIFAAGALYAGVLLVDWISGGFGTVEFTIGSLLASTAIIIGLQTVFSSFYLSALTEL
ncbi:glycosyltransferase family 2 protein [Saliphagus infecundisoli]|uniref:Glycosyltransferase family 2 protein n=1 Tax=Saliphagus infecundisoli TaxID=1849069 RepID=A0ABD5QK90_9EURY|nr:glycosyltransferase family 2 protein [Saliphagus infecundisoli]